MHLRLFNDPLAADSLASRETPFTREIDPAIAEL